MTVYLLVFAAVLVLSMALTPVARLLAPHLGVMDIPSARKVHQRPVPRLGGLAIYLAVLVAAIVLGERFNFAQFGSIIVGATAVSFMGLVDDRWGLRPMVKLVGQILAALLLWATGVRVGTFGQPILDFFLTIFWVVYITNALNLLDNMDGLAGGVAAIAAAHFALMCSFSEQYLVGALSMAVLAACLGFLFYNLNPASIFMGDSGALFLGFMLAAIGIKLRFPENVTFVTWMVPVLVMGLPIFDTALVTFSRLRRGLNPLTTPGKDHVSHRLVAAGLTPREAVLTLYVVSFLLGLLALFVTRASVVEGYIVGGAVALAGLFALWRLERPPFWKG
ncbi:MAG: MraY family glycosyltransferase [Anaerolineae bacterium]|nr:undecaprenyl/decaprenyl-phosphate alpha-N-acetylglucosaminyl 1-phosphate transferase [Anaerolineae bacterium]MCX8066497.1 undecaprenyl/decaprenyl-phosphate alpha-N-acetylglucosaminyl 1-phosphate transferase [Anaerolineae bacterium]MDW7991119.1 MraY family glycosyltransferase [Anaerolineae bacterium]